MKRITAIVASVLSAILASICCLPLLGVLVFSVSSSFVSTLESLRPIFWVLSAVSLTIGFYLTYKRPADCCDFKKKTCWENNVRMRKIILWIVTIINLTIIFYPYL